MIDADALTLESKLADIGVDSFSLVELIFVAEEEFGIKVPIDALSVTTVKDVVGVIGRQIVARPSA
jgi:acyl carrier protein